MDFKNIFKIASSKYCRAYTINYIHMFEIHFCGFNVMVVCQMLLIIIYYFLGVKCKPFTMLQIEEKQKKNKKQKKN